MVSKLLSTRRRVAVAFLAAGLVTAFLAAPVADWARQ